MADFKTIPAGTRVGARFGRLTIVEMQPKHRALCLCDCGNTRSVRRDCLKSGNTKSCGCLRDECACVTAATPDPFAETA